MARIPVLLAGLMALFANAVFAETLVARSGPNQTPVLELYTSEGCSSCPPADAWLAQLVEIPKQELDVLALAFHVDYWDYIGWKDEFANPSYTQRQRELAAHNRQSSIYTPGFYVDGHEARGSLSILERIRKANQTPATIEMELMITPENGGFGLVLNSAGELDSALQVQFVVYEDDLSNQVERGENAGRELHHQRVVRYLSKPIALQAKINHIIPLQEAWKHENLGIAALIKSDRQRYLQSVSRDL